MNPDEWESSEFFDWMEEHDYDRHLVEKIETKRRTIESMRADRLLSHAEYQGELLKLQMFPGLATGSV